MEIMEDGNLVDKVRILLQRDMQYYQEQQTVLREPLCIRVSGGKLDFPRHASFAAIKIVTWWEAEFAAAFERSSGLSFAMNGKADTVDGDATVIKKIQPDEFIHLLVDTAEELLDHLHTLIQESLDHADLTVLTATLGAAALVRNCLWCYTQNVKNKIASKSSEIMNKMYKSYNEMAEAVAERLLDLHCRLISLYILNEADSLNWHSNKYFFEKERCSYVIQMWWLYMQGTKTDLWHTVSPKMAQRVFAAMLNESLTILTSRFVHGRPSLARSEQFWTDAFNVLCCSGYLALAACTSGDELIGARLNRLSTAVRDIHAKCNELLIALVLRGTPLKQLYQVTRNGLEDLAMSKQRGDVAPWLLVCAPQLLGFSETPTDTSTLPDDKALILELNVLKHQPQPNWPQIMKILSMDRYSIAIVILKSLVVQCFGKTIQRMTNYNIDGCEGFLCSGSSCHRTLKILPTHALYSLFHVLAATVNDPERVIIPALRTDPDWSNYVDRKQVWNQARPPWLLSILDPLEVMMIPIVRTLLRAVKTGASIYQAMSLALCCFNEIYSCAPTAILQTVLALDDYLPANCHPIGGSVLLQVLCASLYTALLDWSTKTKNSGSTNEGANVEFVSFNPHDESASSIALAEAICSIDEDNKHTAQINSFLQHVRQSLNPRASTPTKNNVESSMWLIETYTDELLFTDTGRRSLKIVHEYLVRSSDWVLEYLRSGKGNTLHDGSNQLDVSPIPKPLTHIMFHIEGTAFDQFPARCNDASWSRVLTMPLSVSTERARCQIMARAEMKQLGERTQEDTEVANLIKQACTTRGTHQKR